jgi:hypothetical protein
MRAYSNFAALQQGELRAKKGAEAPWYLDGRHRIKPVQ